MTIATTDIGFWQAMLILFVWVPFAMAWVFAFFDLFRRDDVSGVSTALWLVVMVLLPLVGTVAYLARRPTDAGGPGSSAGEIPGRRFHWEYSGPAPGRLRELQLLSDLHDAGKLTDAEFADQKRKVLAA